MERRSYGFYTKRSQHYDNLQNSEPSIKQPLKDATNTPASLKSTSNNNENENNTQSDQQSNNHRDNQSESAVTVVNNGQSGQNQQGSRSLACLETLAQKAGITVDDCKYDIANTLLNLDRGHERSEYQDMNSEISQKQTQQMVDANAQAQAAQQAAVQQQQLQQAQQQAAQMQQAHDAAQQQAAAQQAAAQQVAAAQQAAAQQVAAQQAAQQVAAQQAAAQQVAAQQAVAQAQAQQQQQQQTQAQTMQVQNASPQHMGQVTVVSSGANMVPSGTNMGPPQQQAVSVQSCVQSVSVCGTISSQAQNQSQHGSQSQIAQPASAQDWHNQRVQVIQQPIQNPTYLQQLYNTQGQLLMPGNIALHPGISPQQIQVITAGKPFQGNQLAPHMLTTAQGKQVLQASQAGNGSNITQGIATFPGYTTIPTIPTTQNQQTLVFSQLGVISSQPNILPAHSAPGNTLAQQKPQDIHKNTQNYVMSGQKVMQKVTQNGGNGQQQQGQCVQVSQAMIGTQPTAQIISPIQPNGQPMQFSGVPWQFSGTIPQVWTTGGLQSQALLAPNPIFIRGTQPDGTPGMFIQHNPQATTTIQAQHNPGLAPNTMQQMGKPRQAIENIQPKQTTARPLSNILPSNASQIRPSVSTQTGGQLQAQVLGAKPGAKVRTKGPTSVRTSPAPNTAQKADAANQTKPQQANMQHQLVAGNKMLVMNTSTGMAMAPGSPMTAEKAQQLAAQNNKALQQQQQTVMLQQQALQQQQQTIQQLHFAQTGAGMTISNMQGQQLVTGDNRSLMQIPVSMAGTPNAQQMQQLQQGIPQTLPLQPNLAVAQQQMTMPMQQIHPQLTSMAPPGTIIGQIQTTPTNTVQGIPQSPTAQTQTQTQTQTAQVAPQPNSLTQQQQDALNSQQQTQTQTQVQMAPPPVPAPLPQTPVKTEEIKMETNQAVSPTESVTPMEVTPQENGLPEASETANLDQPKHQELEQKQPQSTIDPPNPQPAPIPGTAPSQPPQTGPTSVDNSIPVAATAEEVKERGPPKAMVKPQVLTHVISDFVIQESSEPFPVTRSTILGDLKHTAPGTGDDEPPKKKHAASPMTNNNNIVGMSPRGELAKCENCGQVDLRAKFKKNKRFCSVACSKKYKSNDKKKWGKTDENGEIDGDASGAESSLSPSEAPEQAQDMEDSSASESAQPKVNPLKWTVNEVCDFIRNLPGCSEYAEDFLIQEIDGQALMLLKEDHLMTAMAMKLGPALKIVAKIDDMRIDKEPNQNQNKQS